MKNFESILICLNKIIYIFCIVLLLLSCSKQSVSTDKTADSIIRVIQDSLKSNISYSRKKIDFILPLTKDSLQHAELISYKAYCLLMTDSLDAAHTLIQRVIRNYKGLVRSPHFYDVLANSYNISGIYYTYVGNYDSALSYHQRAYDFIRMGSQKKNIPDLCINLADMYFKKSDYSNSAFYYRKALLYSDSLQITEKMGFPIYFGLGEVYLSLRDFTLSDYYFTLAEKTLDKRSLSEKFTFCNNRGNFYYFSESYSEALKWFLKARALVLQGNYTFSIHLCELNMSDVYMKLGQLDSAQYYTHKIEPYFKQINHSSALYYLTTINAGIALKKGDVVLAYQLVKDNTDTIGIEKSMISIRLKLLQNYYEKIGDFRQAYFYLQKNDRIENSLQSERVKGRVTEIDMRYKQDTTMLRRDFLIRDQSEKLKNMKLSRYLLISIITIILIIIVFLYFHIKKQRYLVHVKHIGQIAKLRLENTRNRISPHFLFNTLSTIQEELHDKPEAGKRLTAIVNMLRCSLLNVEKPYISLKEEIEFVENYILLQKAKHDLLQTEIYLDSPDLGNLKIPAMIVQIPVENAIKHGLAGKQAGEKVLKVNACAKDGFLKVSVVDNGIGRDKAGIGNKVKGTGTGLKVISQTLHLLNSRNLEKIEFALIDLKDETGNNCGTRVDISIPLTYNFEILI
jgi:tetratricopeptide (TPR) repeat protein